MLGFQKALQALYTLYSTKSNKLGSLNVDTCMYRGIHGDVIVYIFTNLHTTLHTEEYLLGKYWLQAA